MRTLEQTIEAQKAHISHLRVKEMVADRYGNDTQKLAARKAYDSACEGLEQLRAELAAAR